MKKLFSEAEVLTELGKKITHARLYKNLTQDEVSLEAGISKRTLERLEAGRSIQLSSFIRVLRKLHYLEAFNNIFPEPTISPMAQLKLQGKQRQRASKKQIRKEATHLWSWRDKP